MIERLLAADAALERDDLDTAEKLFVQVADADPRNAIAAVGLGRVAAGRNDAGAARSWFERALEIDPDEAAARRLLEALDRESWAQLPAEPAAALPIDTAADPDAAEVVAREPVAAASVAAAATPPRRPTLLARVLILLGLRRSGGGR